MLRQCEVLRGWQFTKSPHKARSTDSTDSLYTELGKLKSMIPRKAPSAALPRTITRTKIVVYMTQRSPRSATSIGSSLSLHSSI